MGGPAMKRTNEDRKGFDLIKWMIVVSHEQECSICASVNTDGGQFTAPVKTPFGYIGLQAIVHEAGTPQPLPLPGEDITKQPIALNLIPGETLEPLSRINFGPGIALSRTSKSRMSDSLRRTQ